MTVQPAAKLSSDRPSTDPSTDLFGHAPFAKTLARAIQGYHGSDGIVLALYGPWGSGKSTVLAFVEHELEQAPEEQRPVVVTFNPWWFSGQENLAKTFLGQLQAVLPEKHAGFKVLGNKLAEFAGALGGVADVAGAALGIPLGGKVIEAGAKLLATKPKDVPALKKAVSGLLLQEKKRVLVVIDDIDRLAPDEVRQLFTVIKALADFPYITYLLAFDRAVATTAISEQTGLPGDRYLEKIIQVPFELPRVERDALLQALFKRLDAVMLDTPAGRFDKSHWENVLWSGLHGLFKVPRDVVRLANALSVTFPAVATEVNPVDFIAIECLRVFRPKVYDAIRFAPEQFVGHTDIGVRHDKAAAIAFHEKWLTSLAEDEREPAKNVLRRLFPKLDAVWQNTYYGGESVLEWRRALRVCAPEVFPAYFRLSLPIGAVSRVEVDELLAKAGDTRLFVEALLSALKAKDAFGVSKVRGLLQRLMDHVGQELGVAQSASVISALMAVGDDLLSDAVKTGAMYEESNETRVNRLVYHLLKLIPPEQRFDLLQGAIKQGRALSCSSSLVSSLARGADKATKGEGEALLTATECDGLKAVWVSRVENIASEAGFIDWPDLSWVLNCWRDWGGGANAIAWWRATAVSDLSAAKLIAAFANESRTQTFGDYAVRRRIRVNPRTIAAFDDIDVLQARLSVLVSTGQVAAEHQPAVEAFLCAYEQMKAGKDPDSFDFDD